MISRPVFADLPGHDPGLTRTVRVAHRAGSHPAFSLARTNSYWFMPRAKNLRGFLFSDAFRYPKIPYTPQMLRVDAFRASKLTKKVLDT